MKGDGVSVGEMRRHLKAMFADVREFLVGEGLGKLATLQENPRGDVTVTQGRSIVAAATPALQAEILAVLAEAART